MAAVWERMEKRRRLHRRGACALTSTTEVFHSSTGSVQDAAAFTSLRPTVTPVPLMV